MDSVLFSLQLFVRDVVFDPRLLCSAETERELVAFL